MDMQSWRASVVRKASILPLKKKKKKITTRLKALNDCFFVVADEDDFSEDWLLGKLPTVAFFPQRQSP